MVTGFDDESLQYPSIKTYLLGLRYFQISAGLGDPNQAHMSKLDYVLNGQTSMGDVRQWCSRTPTNNFHHAA